MKRNYTHYAGLVVVLFMFVIFGCNNDQSNIQEQNHTINISKTNEQNSAAEIFRNAVSPHEIKELTFKQNGADTIICSLKIKDSVSLIPKIAKHAAESAGSPDSSNYELWHYFRIIFTNVDGKWQTKLDWYEIDYEILFLSSTPRKGKRRWIGAADYCLRICDYTDWFRDYEGWSNSDFPWLADKTLSVGEQKFATNEEALRVMAPPIANQVYQNILEKVVPWLPKK